MLFYNFETLDSFIQNNLISSIREEKEKLEKILNLYENKKSKLFNGNNIDSLDKVINYATNLKEELEKIISLCDKNLDMNYNEIKASLIEFNNKYEELFNNILEFENSTMPRTNLLENNELDNFILNIENTDKDNNTLIISEKYQKAYLPFKIDDVRKIYENSNGKYKSIKDVINDLYILPLKKFNNSSISRFREAYNLITKKEHGSIFQAVSLGLEVMFKYELNPIIISACKNLDEFDIYLNCLEENELYDFDCFEIKFEVSPQITKQNLKSGF